MTLRRSPNTSAVASGNPEPLQLVVTTTIVAAYDGSQGGNQTDAALRVSRGGGVSEPAPNRAADGRALGALSQKDRGHFTQSVQPAAHPARRWCRRADDG